MASTATAKRVRGKGTKTAAPARKTARKKAPQAKKGQGKAPKTQQAFLAQAIQEDPTITAASFAEKFNLEPATIFQYQQFGREYVKDYNVKNAALRLGYSNETAQNQGNIMFHAAYTQLWLQEHISRSDIESICSVNQVVARIWQEANAPDVAFSSNSSTRIAALKLLTQILGLLSKQQGPTNVINAVVVPLASNPAEWSAHALSSQTALKDRAIDV